MIVGFVAGLLCGLAVSFVFGAARSTTDASVVNRLERELDYERAQHAIWKKAAEDLGRICGVR